MSNHLIIKPKFWADALWVYPFLMLILGMGLSVFMWRLCKGDAQWMGLSVIMNLLTQPIFLLLWIDNLSNKAIFEDNQVILKGFLHKKIIVYKDIQSIAFSDLTQPTLYYYNPKLNRQDFMNLFIWNHSINILIDEIKKRTNIKVDGYPDIVNRRNFNAKIWFLSMILLTFTIICFIFWSMPELKTH